MQLKIRLKSGATTPNGTQLRTVARGLKVHTGVKAGGATFQDLSFTAKVNKSSPVLFL